MIVDIAEVEAAVSQFTPQQLADFRAWFAAFEARAWNQQLATDVAAGRLDTLSDEALSPAQLRAGWPQLATQNLARAYGEDEPDYFATDLKQANPDYAGR